jgi:fructose-specific phosphotransferase system IIC component
MGHNNYKSNTDVSSNELSDSRFGTILCFLRLGAIPLQIQSLSKVKTAYNTACVVCGYITLVCAIMDMFVHRQDMVQAIKKLRIVFGWLLITWIHLNLRYATLQPTYFDRI